MIDTAPLRPSRRWWLVGLALLVVVAAAVWIVRAALWPCGALDRTSGCVSSVTLDVAALGLSPADTYVEARNLDLGPDAGVALVGLKTLKDGEWRVLLAVFDAGSGQPVRVLSETTGAEPWMGEIALSPDASLAAAVISQGGSTALEVYRLADGSLVRRLWEDASSGRDCVSMLDFGADGRMLQCYTLAHDLETGATESLVDDNGDFRFPILAAFSAMGTRAPDGTDVRLADLNAGLELFDSLQRAFFASDSQGLLSLRIAHGTNRGQRLYTPPGFRRMAAVTVWDGQTLEIQREFYANQRYRWAAWSQDAKLFGLLTSDLRLDIFTR